MKFIKVTQQDTQDLLIINLANIEYILVDKKASSCLIGMTSQVTIKCAHDQVETILKQISEYNRQLIEYLTLEPNTEESSYE